MAERIGAASRGSNLGNRGGTASEPVGWMGRPHSMLIDLPPLAGLALVHDSYAGATTETDAMDDALDADAQ